MQSESEEGVWVWVLELEDDILFFYLGVGSVKFFFTSLLYIVASQVTTCLLGFLVKGFRLYSFQLPDSMSPVLLFIVTTSPCQDWVICAPAAFLGCGSRFSGSLSGIEP